nr:MAG: hypothetical protein BWK75_01275 [Candidatus Altiarchaeales archaeon A3]
MNKLEKEFLKVMSEAFEAYNKFGARSNKKLIPLHSWIAKTVKNRLGADFKVNSLGNGSEKKLDGKYYPKRLDITVIKEDKILATISFKFVTANYDQNSNNYFEQLLGETANIRRVNVGFTHMLVLRAYTPYFDKNKGNLKDKQKKTEILNEHHLSKYIKLFLDQDFPHKPEVLGIIVTDFDGEGNCHFADLNELKISNKTKKALNSELSLEKFIDRFVALCLLKS